MKRSNLALSLSLLSCITLCACDGADSFDELDAAQLAQLTAPPRGRVLTPHAAASTQQLSASSSAPATHGLVQKVKAPEAEHMVGWVRWANAQAFADGAVADPTGEQCALGQEGEFWYLAGTFGGPVSRGCEVPAGKTLVLPLVNSWRVYPPSYFPDAQSIEDFLPLVESWLDEDREATCELTLRIDGQEVRDSLAELDEDFYIRVMEPFEIDLHPEHWATQWFDGGLMPATGAGHYAVITPLPPGEHVIEFGGEICGDYPFSTSASYTLQVGP